MKSISVFDVQTVNNVLKQNNYDYVLKLHDVCGSQSISLECFGNKEDVNVLCDVINEALKDKFIKVKAGTINPYNLIIF